jgi:hypothetical protein
MLFDRVEVVRPREMTRLPLAFGRKQEFGIEVLQLLRRDLSGAFGSDQLLAPSFRPCFVSVAASDRSF